MSSMKTNMEKKTTGGIPRMDRECVALCDAINLIPGIETVESCCGHADREFLVFFRVKNLKHLPVLLYHIDPCHLKITRWDCRVTTDCAMAPVSFNIRSRTTGRTAYREPNKIAKEIRLYMKAQFQEGPA